MSRREQKMARGGGIRDSLGFVYSFFPHPTYHFFVAADYFYPIAKNSISVCAEGKKNSESSL